MTVNRHATLQDLIRHYPVRPAWHLQLVQQELNGGKTSAAELDDLLGPRPGATALTVSGLDQKAFEHFVRRWGAQFTALYFFKCPRIVDLAPLEQLPGLTQVVFFWNQKATRFWDFSKTPALRGLHADDFKRLSDLSDLSGATSLEELAFGGPRVDSLAPLASLQGLRRLSLATAPDERRVTPLAQLGDLETLFLPTGIFVTEQLAWLRARLPDVQCSAMEAFLRLQSPFKKGDKTIDVLVSGKGKPFLSSSADAARLARYSESFAQLVTAFHAETMPEPA